MCFVKLYYTIMEAILPVLLSKLLKFIIYAIGSLNNNLRLSIFLAWHECR